MDYSSVEEILASGTTNMEVIRNNTKNDDGTDKITGVSWFDFNGTTANDIYVSGNSWLGFGSSSEHLKVNRRDGAMYYVYREEGTLYGYYNFLKIRCSGYSRYNYSTSSYAIEYDVILWSTGDISLHMIKIPTSYNTGTYSLVSSSTYSYSVSTAAPDITFKKTDSGFEVSNTVIELELPYNKGYLLRQGTDLYTVVNGVLQKLEITELSASVFLNNGFKSLQEVISVIKELINPEVLYWTDTDKSFSNLIIEGAPFLPVEVISKTEMIPDGTSISIIEALATDDVLFSISCDDGKSWMYYNGIEWKESTSLNEGMNSSVVNSVNSTNWNLVIGVSNSYKFRYVLFGEESMVECVAVKYV